MTYVQFPNVADGIYDDRRLSVRYHIVSHSAVRVISRMWLDSGKPVEGASADEQAPWATYKDIPHD